jgi:hypothetical protein
MRSLKALLIAAVVALPCVASAQTVIPERTYVRPPVGARAVGPYKTHSDSWIVLHRTGDINQAEAAGGGNG